MEDLVDFFESLSMEELYRRGCGKPAVIPVRNEIEMMELLVYFEPHLSRSQLFWLRCENRIVLCEREGSEFDIKAVNPGLEIIKAGYKNGKQKKIKNFLGKPSKKNSNKN